MKTHHQISLKKTISAGPSRALRRSLAARLTAVIAGCMSVGGVDAQMCQAPLLITGGDFNAQIDTCQSTYAPEALCGGGLPVAGPAVVFQINLPYPQASYTFVAEPINGAVFDPMIVVESQQCGESGNCPFAIDNAATGMGETFNFGNLDSGTYYLVVTSENPDARCGLTRFGFETGVIDTDGIFRSGMN